MNWPSVRLVRPRARAADPICLLLLAATAGCERGEPRPVEIAVVHGPARADHPEAGAPAPPPIFEECAEQRGLRFTWRSGHAGRYLNPEIVGGGVALIDHDDDGDLDVFLVQGGGVLSPQQDGDRLFANDGAGRFTDVTEASGIREAAFGMGAAVGDYDDDGDEDLYVTNLGPNVLWRNDGGRFTDATATAGVGDPGWSSSAGFVDVEGDGDLDLFVCNYILWTPGRERACLDAQERQDYCTPSAYQAPAHATLYRNRGDGTFEDATVELGIDTARGTALGITFGDWDGDGRTEIFVASDGMMNHLWVPGTDGRFRDQALQRGCATGESGQLKAGMGVAAGDIDLDGDVDLLAVNLRRETDSLFINDGRWFRDSTAAWRLAAPSRRATRFGAGFADFDQDGLLDLYQANGGVQRLAQPLTEDPYAEPNALYRGVPRNLGQSPGGRPSTASDIVTEPGAFVEWLPQGGTAEPLVRTSRGAAFGDLDGDGAIDVVVVNRDAPVSLLRNVAPERGHWLMLRVLERSGRHALGATVLLTVGDRIIRRDVLPTYSYCASNDPRVHVGLGASSRVEAIEVRWADGARDRFPGAAADQVVELQRGGPTDGVPRIAP